MSPYRGDGPAPDPRYEAETEHIKAKTAHLQWKSAVLGEILRSIQLTNSYVKQGAMYPNEAAKAIAEFVTSYERVNKL